MEWSRTKLGATAMSKTLNHRLWIEGLKGKRNCSPMILACNLIKAFKSSLKNIRTQEIRPRNCLRLSKPQNMLVPPFTKRCCWMKRRSITCNSTCIGRVLGCTASSGRTSWRAFSRWIKSSSFWREERARTKYISTFICFALNCTGRNNGVSLMMKLDKTWLSTWLLSFSITRLTIKARARDRMRRRMTWTFKK